MNFLHPAYARQLLAGDQLELTEGEAKRLGIRLRDPPRPRWLCWMHDDRIVLKEMLVAAGTDLGMLAEVVEYLAVTCTIDLRVQAASVPWLWLVARFLNIDPTLAATAARKWYGVVVEVTLDLCERVPGRPFTAYTAGVVSAQRVYQTGFVAGAWRVH